MRELVHSAVENVAGGLRMRTVRMALASGDIGDADVCFEA